MCAMARVTSTGPASFRTAPYAVSAADARAAVNLASAALTMTLLVSLPLGAFLAVKQLSGFAVTAGAVFLTVSLSLSTARREGLAFVPAPHPVPVVLVE